MNQITVVEIPEISVISVGEQGPPGPPGAAGASTGDASNIISVQSGELVDLPRCTPLAMQSNLMVRASTGGQAKVYGLVYDAVLHAGGFGQVITGSVLTATTDEWDAVTFQIGGLTPGKTYYLDSTIGRLTLTPSFSQPFLVRVGYALSATQLRLFLDSPVSL